MTLVERLRTYPTGRRRALALGLIALTLAMLWCGVIEPVHQLLGSQGDWRRQARRELAHLRGRAAVESELLQQIQSLDAAPVWKAFYVVKDEADAAEQIGRDLASIAASAGVSAPIVVPLSKREQPEYTAYGARFQGAMSAEQLKKFGTALRDCVHFLRIEHLEAQAPQVQSADQNPTFSVVLEIYGYVAPVDASSRSGDSKAVEGHRG